MSGTKKNTAIIFNIQRHSIHDGPGIRTCVFLKGCSLSCIWCSNPESINSEIEVGFERSKCIYCGNCIEACKYGAINPDLKDNDGYKIDSKKCISCGECIQACPTGALNYIGKETAIDEVYQEIERDIPFYKTSSGGVTFTGGEPLLQIDFLEEILKKAFENNISTAVETCGNVSWDNFEKIIPYTDYFLFDIKHTDPKKHKEFTGSDNKLIIENLKRLSKETENIILRFPLIQKYNDDKENIYNTAKLAKSLNIKEINILPYHRLGINKYVSLKKEYLLKDLQDMSASKEGRKKIDECKKILEEMDINVTIGG